jgi:hypothetical protein
MASTFRRARDTLAGSGPGTLTRAGFHSALRRIPSTGTPLYYRYRAHRNWMRSGDYVARPDPFRIVRVAPDRIAYNSGRRFSYIGDRYEDAGLIAGGDWDVGVGRFCDQTVYSDGEDTIYRSFVERFENGRNWEEVPFVRRILRELERDSGWTWHGCESREEVLERCREMDRLFHDIDENGYRSKRELLDSREDAPRRNPERFHFLNDEVVVNVGRDGRLLFVGGHHRLSIAKILDVPGIPVRLFVRHRGWQELRDDVHAGAEPPVEFRSHPDLRDVIG